MRASLLIFDCDGVLVDSEAISTSVMAQFITEQGWALSPEECLAHFKGLSMSYVWCEVENRTGRAVTKEQHRDFRSRQLAALALAVTPLPGARELLTGLSIPFCVASNGPHEKMAVTLLATGLLALCQGKIFSAGDVERPKPFPDLFLHAAQEMGVPADACLVIEDSPIGVQAALAAGMRVVGLRSGSPTSELEQAGAHVVIDSLAELLAYL